MGTIDLSEPAVIITGGGAKLVLPEMTLTEAERAQIAEIGDNTNCMTLKGANPEFSGDPLPDRWPLSPELEAVAKRWKIEPTRDLSNAMPAAGAV